MLTQVYNYINLHGGPYAVLLSGVAAYCLLMSSIAKLCNILKIQESPFLVKAGNIGSALQAWFGANIASTPKGVVPTPDTSSTVTNPPNA